MQSLLVTIGCNAITSGVLFMGRALSIDITQLPAWGGVCFNEGGVIFIREGVSFKEGGVSFKEGGVPFIGEVLVSNREELVSLGRC